MKTGFVKNTFKLLAIVFAAMISLCSCGDITNAASGLVSSVMENAGSEISSAISEGLGDLSDGWDNIKSGISEASNGINEAGSVISEKIGDIGSKVSDGLDGVSDDIRSAISEASENAGDIVVNIGSGLSGIADNIIPETSVSSDDTTQQPVENKQYTFRNKDRFDEHYEKHGDEFGDITEEQYLELANELINSTSITILHKNGDNGDKKYYDPDNNYFLILSGDGYIRTFFRPSAGMKYWDKQ